MFLIEEAHISWSREFTDMLHCTLPSQLTFLFLYPINFKVTILLVNSTKKMLFSEKGNLAWIVFHSCFALSISGFSDFFFFFLLISYFLIIRLIERRRKLSGLDHIWQNVLAWVKTAWRFPSHWILYPTLTFCAFLIKTRKKQSVFHFSGNIK